MDTRTVFAGWNYVIEETDYGPQRKRLGAGGFGNVYEIKKEDGIDFRSAMKVISIPKDDDEIKQYIVDGNDQNQIEQILTERKKKAVTEINMLIKLKYNPNIVGIEDYVVKEKENEIGWDLFIRMELLSSINDQLVLAKKEKEKSFNPENVRQLGIDICNALDECHEIGLLHRDIKPGNLFVDKNGHYKLGDFGISRVMDVTTGIVSATRTEKYAAPEVIRMEKHRATADIYSLGLVMYELLNDGRLPFMPPAPEMIRQKDSEMALIQRLKGEKIEPIDDVPDELNDIILKACAFDPKDRFDSAKEMKEQLIMTSTELSEPRLKPEKKEPNGPKIEMSDRMGRSVIFTKKALFIDGEEFRYTGMSELKQSQNYHSMLFKYNGKWQKVLCNEDDYNNVVQLFSRIKALHVRQEKQAADNNGSGTDSLELGNAYYYGQNHVQDYKTALYWYEQAAHENEPQAYLMIGKIYEEGNGIEQDYSEAVEWYKRSAYYGNQYAQLRLGKMYESGKGIRQSFEEAAKWYEESANQGNKNAKWHLNKLNKRIGE